MQRPKAVALMFLVGALVVGSVMGVFVDRMMLRDRLLPPRMGERQARQIFFDELGFTTEQQTAWNGILDERAKKVAALYAPVRQRADSIRDSYRPQMLQLLTKEQRSQLEAREQKMIQERERRTRDRKPPPEK
jgi:uncharacterized protein YneF (UPF0154 family)